MNGFVEISTLLIHSAPKQKSNEWMHLSPFYTRMHGEWLRYAKSTSQFHWRFLLVRDVRGIQVNPLCRHDITRSDRQIGNPLSISRTTDHHWIKDLMWYIAVYQQRILHFFTLCVIWKCPFVMLGLAWVHLWLRTACLKKRKKNTITALDKIFSLIIDLFKSLILTRNSKQFMGWIDTAHMNLPNPVVYCDVWACRITFMWY